jgi:phosphoribosylglycinamide formyltransferase-1
MKTKKCRLAIFASGGGTNAEAIIQYFATHPAIDISCIYSNNADAYVLERAKNYNIPANVFSRKEFFGPVFMDNLVADNFDLIILAGFMWLVPPAIVKAYPNKIINIHPALLPSYGGKGMYGHFVHEAVINNKEVESGITIHYVNEYYDEGSIILQAKCPVLATDSPDSLANKIHILEHRHYPEVIEKICNKIF